MSKLKEILVGIDDFKKIIDKGSYFVDKSLLIKKIIENISEVILFTRPRRFGKTINFSMLKYFLEIPEVRAGNQEAQPLKNYLKTLIYIGKKK